MPGAAGCRVHRRDVPWLVTGVALPISWLLSAAVDGDGLSALSIVPITGAAIVGAAFMLSWACDLAERDVPRSLALLMLALVGVLP